MTDLISSIGDALLMAAGMAWKTAWTLVLGFTISAVLQALVPAASIRHRLGGSGIGPIGLAAASSSCSYAAAAGWAKEDAR